MMPSKRASLTSGTLTEVNLAMSVGVVDVARQAARIVTDGPWEPSPAAAG
jgi:hypothetical protein